MILSRQSIVKRTQEQHWWPSEWEAMRLQIDPFVEEKTQKHGLSYGLSHCGYDIRVGKIKHERLVQGHSQFAIYPGEFILMSSLEKMRIPLDVCARVHDKSTLARLGLALQNTILEPGWEGHITLELSNHSSGKHFINIGQPIAQVIFEQIDQIVDVPYSGKYQNQGPEPVPAKFEEEENGRDT